MTFAKPLYPNDKPCLRCDGTGFIDQPGWIPPPGVLPVPKVPKMQCPDCAGSGKISK